jgi:hypothetical protein
MTPLALAAALTLSASHLPDRLPRVGSADFALAAERSELEPNYRKRPLGLDYNGVATNPHFYFWTVIPTWGQGVDYFYVDRRTGSVWGGYADCRPIHSPHLAALQARFRRKVHIAASEAQRIEREGSPEDECQP